MWFRKKAKQIEDEITEKNLNNIIDFTYLNPIATKRQLENFVCVAYKHNYYAVCVNPCNVRAVKEFMDVKFKRALKVVAVVGFPLGQNLTEIKVLEAKRAVADGADEIDLTLNFGKIKDGNFREVKDEIARVVRASKGKIVKVIIETAYLTKTEIEKTCQMAVKAKADFVMSSTGFAPDGATPEIIEIMSNAVNKKIGVKASGGIFSVGEAINMVRMGATRIGTSKEL